MRMRVCVCVCVCACVCGDTEFHTRSSGRSVPVANIHSFSFTEREKEMKATTNNLVKFFFLFQIKCIEQRRETDVTHSFNKAR